MERRVKRDPDPMGSLCNVAKRGHKPSAIDRIYVDILSEDDSEPDYTVQTTNTQEKGSDTVEQTTTVGHEI